MSTIERPTDPSWRQFVMVRQDASLIALAAGMMEADLEEQRVNNPSRDASAVMPTGHARRALAYLASHPEHLPAEVVAYHRSAALHDAAQGIPADSWQTVQYFLPERAGQPGGETP